jgi:hypothetical protein
MFWYRKKRQAATTTTTTTTTTMSPSTTTANPYYCIKKTFLGKTVKSCLPQVGRFKHFRSMIPLMVYIIRRILKNFFSLNQKYPCNYRCSTKLLISLIKSHPIRFVKGSRILSLDSFCRKKGKSSQFLVAFS